MNAAPLDSITGKKVAIVQSNYIPWKGYFDLIAAVDEFIIYDDMQYTRRDWRNRNKIKTRQGPQWLTVPVKVKGKYHQTIRETEIEGTAWAESHWKSLSQNYCQAACFNEIAEFIRPLYLDQKYSHLTDLNETFIRTICDYMGIKTKISHSWDYEIPQGKTERLIALTLQAGGSEYISGPSAKDYLDEELFTRSGLQLSWFDYAGYNSYPQLWGEFIHEVTVLDLLFNCGKELRNHMRYIRNE